MFIWIWSYIIEGELLSSNVLLIINSIKKNWLHYGLLCVNETNEIKYEYDFYGYFGEVHVTNACEFDWRFFSVGYKIELRYIKICEFVCVCHGIYVNLYK